ncbi:MAG: transglycosylase SLT domain-containing protein [Acidimicrobiia bacterium]
MRPRIPLAYAGLLIIALVAVVGFAAFSPSSDPEEPQEVATVAEDAIPPPEASARVASAVLALRVSDAESRTATTNAAAESTTTSAAESDVTTTSAAATEETSATPDTAAAAAPDPTTSSAATPQQDTTPPSIKVTSHDDGDTVSDRIVSFIGTTEPGATVASGPYEADVSDGGEWELSLVMAPGPNGAHFTATDDAGNTASTRIVLNYEPPAAATTTTKANTTTTSGSSGTTTTTSGGSSWSPNWPADSGGRRDVESWRSTVASYWPANRVDCVLGIIKRESGGDPRAFNSSSKAEGLMQHLSKYWESRAIGAGFVDGNGKVATPYNGAANIAAGAYLAGWAQSYQSAWWWPWKSSGGVFTAQYGSCTSSNPS